MKTIRIPTASEVPIEVHSAIYSASLIIIIKLIGLFFGNLPQMIDESIYQKMLVYLGGICTKTKNQTCLGVAKFFKFLVSHDTLSDMLVHPCWSATIIMCHLLNFAISQVVCHPIPCWLILDDVILPHNSAKKMYGTYYDYDYVNCRNIRCMRLVVLVWTNGIINIPVAFSLWHKKGSQYLKDTGKHYRTKNELARILVYLVVRKGLHFNFITFDEWYSKAENLSFFHRLELIFVTSVKSNRKIRIEFISPFIQEESKKRRKKRNCLNYTCMEWAELFHTRDYPYYSSIHARARRTFVHLKGVKTLLKLVCIKNYANNKHFKDIHTPVDKRAKDPNKYLITNGLLLTIPQIVNNYRRRWTIEVAFRTLKQEFALGKCQAHKSIEPHLRHTALCFFAFVLLQLAKIHWFSESTDIQTIGDVKAWLQKQMLCIDNQGYSIREINEYKIQFQEIIKIENLLTIPIKNSRTSLASNNRDTVFSK